MKRYAVAAPFFTGRNDVWLDDYVTAPGVAFTKILPTRQARDWHRGGARFSGLGDWARYAGQAWRSLRGAPDGVITSFPQLAMCVGVFKRLRGADCRVIAYNFNVGTFRPGLRRRLARWAARAIDVFVVHSPSEVAPYAAYFDVPPDRVRFVPLQRGALSVTRHEDTAQPYVVAMGSAHRDYPTLIAAVDALGVRTIIVTRATDAARLPRSAHVTLLSDQTREACLELLAGARLSVTPMANVQTASGQVTFINAMQMGVPLIVTRCPGSDGYVEDGVTGLLVPPHDVPALTAAIARLWDDPAARAALAAAGRTAAETRFSDAGAARALTALLEP